MTAKKTKSKKRKKIPFEKEILDYLRKRQGRSFRKKEISKALGVRKSTYHMYRDTLKALLNNGKVARVSGGRYTWPGGEKSRIQGELMLTKKGFAFVADPNGSEDIYISAQNLGTAFNRDVVEVQVSGATRGRSREGRVDKIIRRATNTFVGTYRHSDYYGFVVPDNPRVYRDFFVPEGKENKAKDGQKVVLRFTDWKPGQMNPEGEVIEVLGYPNEPGVDITAVVMDHGIAMDFNQQLEKEARKVKLTIDGAELAKRLDLRDLNVITIDPPDAKDFDDAISLEKLENGHLRLGVHIADVSHFVQPNTALDKEALERGTSVYLVDRVIPMLPEYLSNELCSLKPDEDRLTYSCIMDITPKGEVADYQIAKTVIRSKRRYTYQEVQKILDNRRSRAKNAGLLREMHKLSRLLRKKRFDRGSIDFDTPEVKFKLDESGKPVEIIPVKRQHSNEMIEDFMLMANQTVGRHIEKIAGRRKPEPFIYRVHEKPDNEKVGNFKEFLDALGYRVRFPQHMTPAAFQNILEKVLGGKDDLVIKEVALRTMMKAVYSPKNVGHFGLGFEHYSHFTSPIRRYPDLLAHRLLKEYEQPITAARRTKLKKFISKVCDITSDRERSALNAERESIRLKQVEWLYEHQDETFEGVISGVMSYGIFVETLPYLIEGLIRVEDLTDDYYIQDEKTYSLIGKDFGRRYRLGDPIKVTVKNVDLFSKEVDFVLVDES